MIRDYAFQALLSTAVAIASAWFAGRLGVRRALQQIKSEKAFERRLDWYERAVGAIGAHIDALYGLVVAVREGFDEGHKSRLVDDLLAKQEELAPVLAQAHLYASKDSAATIVGLVHANASLLIPQLVDARDRSKGFRLPAADLERAAEHGLATVAMLGTELRAHLGLEPLN